MTSLKFTTRVRDSHARSIKTHFSMKQNDVDNNPFTATVYWTMDFEVREWGLKSIYTSIDQVIAEIEYTVYDQSDEHGDITENGVLVIDSLKDGWKIEDRLEMREDFCAPSYVMIDFETKTIEVE
jgi:hypothetical protein